MTRSNIYIPRVLQKYPPELRAQIAEDYAALLARDNRALLGEVQTLLSVVHCAGWCTTMTALRADIDELFEPYLRNDGKALIEGGSNEAR